MSFPHNGSYNADASLAIDGITDGIFDHGSVTHTDEIYTNWKTRGQWSPRPLIHWYVEYIMVSTMNGY